MTKHSTTLTTALKTVYEALAPLANDDRRKVVNSAFILIGEDTRPKVQAQPIVTAPTKQQQQPEPIKLTATQDVLVKRIKATAQTVRDYFAAYIGKPVTRQDLLKAFGRDNERTVDQEVSRLVKVRAVVRGGAGRYTMPLPTGGKANAAQH
jgi:hypothetical protein